jgi:hypothetical protein
MKILILLLTLTALLMANIGTVSVVLGEVIVDRVGSTILVQTGSTLEERDIIKTSDNSKVQIIFKDETILTIGELSEFKIEEYLFEEQQEPKFKVSFVKGAFRSITGKIGKIAPKKFKLKTKTATMGIRGTHFMGQITDAGDRFACTYGEITVTPISGGAMVAVPAGQITFVAPQAAPTPPRAFKAEEIKSMSDAAGAKQQTSSKKEKTDSVKKTLTKVAKKIKKSSDSESSDPIVEIVESKAVVEIAESEIALVLTDTALPSLSTITKSVVSDTSNLDVITTILEQKVTTESLKDEQAILTTVLDEIKKQDVTTLSPSQKALIGISDEVADDTEDKIGSILDDIKDQIDTINDDINDDISDVVDDTPTDDTPSEDIPSEDVTPIEDVDDEVFASANLVLFASKGELENATGYSTKGVVSFDVVRRYNENDKTLHIEGQEAVSLQSTPSFPIDPTIDLHVNLNLNNIDLPGSSYTGFRTLADKNIDQLSLFFSDQDSISLPAKRKVIYDNLGEVVIIADVIEDTVVNNTNYHFIDYKFIAEHGDIDALTRDSVISYTPKLHLERINHVDGIHSKIDFTPNSSGKLFINTQNRTVMFFDNKNSHKDITFGHLYDDGSFDMMSHSQELEDISNDFIVHYDYDYLGEGSLYGSQAQAIQIKDDDVDTIRIHVASRDMDEKKVINDNPKNFIGLSSGLALNDDGDTKAFIKPMSLQIDPKSATINGKFEISFRDQNAELIFNTSNSDETAAYITNDMFASIFDNDNTHIAGLDPVNFTIFDGNLVSSKVGKASDVVSWGYWNVDLSGSVPFLGEKTASILPLSVWISGELTPQLPSGISKHYEGEVIGFVGRDQIDGVNSSFAMDVDFGTSSDHTFTSEMKFKTLANNDQWHVKMDGTSSSATTISTGTESQVGITSGQMEKNFYGQQAQVVGGVFNLQSDTGLRASGAFKANEKIK